MGWDSSSSWKNKKDVVNDLKRSMERNNWTVHAEKASRDGVWFVVENSTGKFIYFGLIQTYRSGKFTEYRLKTMTESMGPASTTCPLKFFEMVEAPNSEFSQNWREEVTEAQNRAKREFKVGDCVYLYGKRYQVSLIALGKYYVRDEGGKVFKLSKRNIQDIELL